MNTPTVQNPQPPPMLSDWDILRHQADTLVKSGFLPSAINTWQKATAIIMYGKELGMGPMEAIQSIDVIQGKPTQKPQSMKAMVHKKLPTAVFRLISSDERQCTFEAARPNDPPTKFQFTIEDAAKLGLTGKDNYKKQAKVMLQWRCIGHIARTVFPDCLSGVIYSPEEMGADVDDEHNIIEITATKTEAALPKETTYVDAVEAPNTPTDAEYLAAVDRFRKLAGEAHKKKLDTSTLYTDPDEALETYDTRKLMAVNAILETKLKG